MKRSTILIVVPLLAILGSLPGLALPPDGAQCAGYGYTRALTIMRSSDMQSVIAQSTIGGFNPCSFYTSVQITSPGARSASAVADYNAGSADATATLAVQTEGGAYLADATYYVQDDTVYPMEYYGPSTHSSSVTVSDPTPVITSISPNVWAAGTSTPVQILGSGFGTSAGVASSDPTIGVAVDSWRSNDTQIFASVTVPDIAPAENVTLTVTSNGYAGGFLPGSPGQAQTASGTANVTPMPTTITVQRTTLTAFTASGSPSGGTFQYTSDAYANVAFAPGVAAQTNPNAAVLSNMANPDPQGRPTPGALATVTSLYNRPSGVSMSKQFHVATFGLSCYYTTTQGEWGSAPNACQTVRIGGNTYSVHTLNPSGLPAGDYCDSFLAEIRLQGSGVLGDGTKAQWSAGSGYRVVAQISSADGSPVQAGSTIARDRAVIPTGGWRVDINGVGAGLLANDVGSAITGYRLDLYRGAGPTACSGFSNIMAIAGCSPGNSTCPAVTVVQ